MNQPKTATNAEYPYLRKQFNTTDKTDDFLIKHSVRSKKKKNKMKKNTEKNSPTNQHEKTFDMFYAWERKKKKTGENSQNHAFLLTQRNSKNGTLIPHFIKSFCVFFFIPFSLFSLNFFALAFILCAIFFSLLSFERHFLPYFLNISRNYTVANGERERHSEKKTWKIMHCPYVIVCSRKLRLGRMLKAFEWAPL